MTLETVLNAVSLGIDLFDSHYPCAATLDGRALTFDFANFQPLQTAAADEMSINIWEADFETDDSAFLPGCQCFACTNHTRAYVHHLLNAHEMLAAVLLMA